MKAAHSRVTVRMDLYIIKGCDVTSRELQDVLFDTLIEFAPPLSEILGRGQVGAFVSHILCFP